jgi:Maltose operon periplasmic protein precursor (MalM)
MIHLQVSMLFTACLLLSACAGVGGGFLPPQHDEVLARTPICCNTIETLNYLPLERDKPLRRLIGITTPTYDFSQGKSFFLALSLPMTKDSDKLIVRSFAQNTLYNPEAHVFVPRITFLSEGHKVIASISPDFFVQRPTYGVGESPWRVDLPIPKDAKYAVVHTSSIERQKVMRMRDSDQRSGYLYIRTGPAGEVEVAIQ